MAYVPVKWPFHGKMMVNSNLICFFPQIPEFRIFLISFRNSQIVPLNFRGNLAKLSLKVPGIFWSQRQDFHRSFRRWCPTRAPFLHTVRWWDSGIFIGLGISHLLGSYIYIYINTYEYDHEHEYEYTCFIHKSVYPLLCNIILIARFSSSGPSWKWPLYVHSSAHRKFTWETPSIFPETDPLQWQF